MSHCILDEVVCTRHPHPFALASFAPAWQYHHSEVLRPKTLETHLIIEESRHGISDNIRGGEARGQPGHVAQNSLALRCLSGGSQQLLNFLDESAILRTVMCCWRLQLPRAWFLAVVAALGAHRLRRRPPPLFSFLCLPPSAFLAPARLHLAASHYPFVGRETLSIIFPTRHTSMVAGDEASSMT